MDDHPLRTDLSVAVLHDLDPSWTPVEKQETRAQVAAMVEALGALGHPVQSLPVCSTDVDEVLSRLDPRGCILLNWVEELPGQQRGCVSAARAFEACGFVYTGATPEVLDLSYDKPRWKSLLREAGVPTPAVRNSASMSRSRRATQPSVQSDSRPPLPWISINPPGPRPRGTRPLRLASLYWA